MSFYFIFFIFNIFIIRVSHELTPELVDNIRNRVSSQLNDYHVLVVVKEMERGEVEFECYNSPKGNKNIKNKKYKIK